MNEQSTRYTREMFSTLEEARIPEAMRAFAEQAVVRMCQSYKNIGAVADDTARALEEVMLSTHAGAKAIGAKAFEYSVANAETAFDAAEAIARAKTIPEIVSLQARYLQQQLVSGSEQMKDLFELSTKFTRDAFDNLSAAGAKSVEHFKKLC